MVRLSSVLGAAVAIFSATTAATSTANPEGYFASDRSVEFSIAIGENNHEDVFFTMSGPSDASWISVGMGNDKMENSLMIMIYSDSTGKGVTVSPRLSYGHVEPSYASNFSYTQNNPSKIDGGRMSIEGTCHNCQSWPGGRIDRTNTAAKFIWAVGPSGSLSTSDLSVGIKRHASYGVFTMDLTKAVGTGNSPIPVNGNSEATKEVSIKTDHDFSSILHACVMILAFLGLMPIGLLILRVMDSVRWHGWNQALSVAVGIIGSFIGVYISRMYNRSNGFKSVHQIIGIVVAILMVGQLVLGYVHHRMYKKTHAPTGLAPIHVWLGRVVIPLGIANGFLGFPLALNPKLNWAMLGMVLLVVVVAGPLLFWRLRRNAQKKKTAFGVATGYQAQPFQPEAENEPWTTASAEASHSNINLQDMNHQAPPGYNRY